MKKRLIFLGATALLGLCRFNAQAQQYDPPCVVEQWSNASTYNKVIDIDFSDSDMPDTWKGKTGTDCPSYSTGGYYNGILEVPIYENGQTSEHTYPLLFHNSTFANKNSYNGFAAATAAFARQFYDGQNATQKNDWTQPGHTVYLEDSITYTAGKPRHSRLCALMPRRGNDRLGREQSQYARLARNRPYTLRRARAMVMVVIIMGTRGKMRLQNRRRRMETPCMDG